MEFRILGPLEVRADGTTVDVGSRRHREVLAALLVDAGSVVSVDTLVDRVWGPDGASPSSVQAIVSRLRARLGDGVIVTQAPGYRLELAGHELDRAELARLLAEARAGHDPHDARTRVATALALWRGRPYADVARPFAEAEAQRLETTRLTAHELLAELDLRLGRHVDVLERLPVLVEEHPLREPLRALLMVALYRAGRQVEALATYDEVRELLAEELGVDPGPELRRLHQQVLRQDPRLEAPIPAPATSGSRRSDLIGRDEHLAVLDKLVAEGVGGTPAVVTVTGEAGIGKTRLVEEAASRAAAGGATVVVGRCWDNDGSPAFWPWEQALSDLVDQIGLDAARAAATGRGAGAALLIAALGVEPVVGGSPEAARARLYDAVTAFLEVVASTRPVVLVLEDLHWADQESVELAAYVAATLRTGRLTVLTTVRDPSEAPGSAGSELVAALARRPGAVRIELDGLGVHEVAELVARRTGSTVSVETAEALRRRTDGNPFYVSELARLYGEERRRSGSAETPVPSGVRAVIERRLRHLRDSDVEVLVAAAVIGRSFGLPLLAEVTGRPRLEVLEVLDRAVSAGVLEADGIGTEQRFAHALVQETLVLSTGRLRRATLHAAIARALDQRHGEDVGHAATTAHHYVSAGALGDPVRGVVLSLAAATAAERRLALSEAERTVRRALDLVLAAPAGEARRLELELRVRLGSLLTLRHGYNGEGVAEERRRALQLAAAEGSTGHLLSALWGTWGGALVSGRFVDAEGVVREIEGAADATGDPMLRLAMHIARGQTAWHRGRLADARSDLERAASLADAEVDAFHGFDLDVWLQHPGVQARGWLAIVLAQQGEIERSDSVAAGAADLVRRVGHPFTATYHDILEGLRAIWLDRPSQARASGDAGLRTAAKHGFEQIAAFAWLPAGWARGRQGEAAAGEEMLESALAAFGSLRDGHMFGHLMLGLLADARWRDGRADDALEAVDAALRESRRTGEQFHLVALHGLRAELLGATGGDPTADEEAARRTADEQGAHLWAGRLR